MFAYLKYRSRVADGLTPDNRCIPTSTAPACTGSQYTVQAGDDCTKIGQAKGVPATDIVKANNLPDDCKSLQPGQQL